MKKILNILLLICVCLPIAAQDIKDGGYQGFKVGKGNNTPDIISIRVNSLSGDICRFSEYIKNEDKPLTGCYHIIIHRNKYIVANISKGVLEGEWTMYSYDKVVEKATFKNGCYDGQRVRTYSDREIYTYKDCELQHYIAYHSNEQLKAERAYKNGKLHGEVKEYNEKGELVKEYNFANGKKHGKRVEVGSNGYSTTANYDNDVQVGEYLAVFKNGNISEKGEYDSNGKKTGKWVLGHEDGNLREEAGYKDGKYHGEVRGYHLGKISTVTGYADGKRDGKYFLYYEYPAVREERTYKNGVLNDVSRDYHKNGTLDFETIYDNGDRVIHRSYRSDGYVESYYKKKEVVKTKRYDKDGKLKSLSLINEKGDLVVVQEYDTAEKVVKTNKEYKKHPSITLKEDASGIIDIE